MWDLMDILWQYAYKRQEIFMGNPVDDEILHAYKFTNCYRACDRVSQYLNKNVITDNSIDCLFRILLFKTYNRIDTWELLTEELGEEPHWQGYSFERYAGALTKLVKSGKKLFSPAFLHCLGRSSFGYKERYLNHLAKVSVWTCKVWDLLPRCRNLEDSFLMMLQQDMAGNFVAMQNAIDINYSELTDFDEARSLCLCLPSFGVEAGYAT